MGESYHWEGERPDGRIAESCAKAREFLREETRDLRRGGDGGCVQPRRIRLYSSCVPIQNQTTRSPSRVASALKLSATLTDQYPLTSLKKRERCHGSFCQRRKASLAAFCSSGDSLL